MNDTKPSISVAVVEDRAEELDALTKLLAHAPGFACVATCRSAKEALAVLPRCQPDIILMDIGLPGLTGIDCVRALRPLLPSSQIMMLTVFEDHDRIFRSLAAGAMGYLLKKTSPSELLEAIQELHEGGAPMSGQIARNVVASFQQPTHSTAAAVQLSPVEQSVLDRLSRGLLYKEVAAELSMSICTVRTHVWHIYRKLQAHNRTEAILKGLGSHPADPV